MKRVKQVVIDNKKGIVEVDGKPIPRLLLCIMRGGVGKCFVVKRYMQRRKDKRLVVTRYPDMSGIVASDKQRERRDLFKEAVVYAKWILSDEERKKAFRKTLPRKRRKHVYQAAIRLYMSMQGDAGWLRKQLAVKGMMQSGQIEWSGKANRRKGEGELMLNERRKDLVIENFETDTFPDKSYWVRAGNLKGGSLVRSGAKVLKNRLEDWERNPNNIGSFLKKKLMIEDG